uniref:Uncharacterized protein n=1 Tax=Rhizophora mucronata TaxID=61149 RepID=A0A2P2PQ84_RHIMU
MLLIFLLQPPVCMMPSSLTVKQTCYVWSLLNLRSICLVLNQDTVCFSMGYASHELIFLVSADNIMIQFVLSSNFTQSVS